MVAVPAATPLTTPVVGFTEAIAALLLLQVPPVPVVARVAVAPGQSGETPLMLPASGAAFTLTAWVSKALPQLLLTV